VGDLVRAGEVVTGQGLPAEDLGAAARNHQAPPGLARVRDNKFLNEASAAIQPKMCANERHIVSVRLYRANLRDRSSGIDVIAAWSKRRMDHGTHREIIAHC
jgi:hypothetical protein